MDKQYVKGVGNRKKIYLQRLSKIVMWLYNSLSGVRDNILTVQRPNTNFWICHVIFYKAPTRHENYQRDLKLYFLYFSNPVQFTSSQSMPI